MTTFETSGQATKRTLIELSHGIEEAVLAAPFREPTILVGLFQERRHFDVERAIYVRLAEAGVHVVVCFVGDVQGVPAVVHPIPLDPGEPLADEWSVIALAPHAGAHLVARDLHIVDPAARGSESGRQFDGRWGRSTSTAQAELVRLRGLLGDRLDRSTCAIIDTLVSSAAISVDVHRRCDQPREREPGRGDRRMCTR